MVVLFQSDILGILNAEQVCYSGMAGAGRLLKFKVAKFFISFKLQ